MCSANGIDFFALQYHRESFTAGQDLYALALRLHDLNIVGTDDRRMDNEVLIGDRGRIMRDGQLDAQFFEFFGQGRFAQVRAADFMPFGQHKFCQTGNTDTANTYKVYFHWGSFVVLRMLSNSCALFLNTVI